MSLAFPRSDVLRAVHDRLIKNYGGLSGIRDLNAFESAVSRPRQLHSYTGESRPAVLAASLGWALMRNHAFVDGNKRIGFAAFAMMVDINHHKLICTQAEETAMALKAAASRITEEEWTAWALSVVVPRRH